jgi:hypothetical protein
MQSPAIVPTFQNRKLLLWLLMPLLLAGCQSDRIDNALKGHVTVWHSWSAAEAAILEEAIGQ